MSRISSIFSKKRLLRWFLAGVGTLTLLLVLFYTEENWRGRRAWEKCKQQLQSQGEVLDYRTLIPPAVPDDQNVYKAPKMSEWFLVKCAGDPAGPTELSMQLSNENTLAVITNHEVALAYLTWSDQRMALFDIVHKGLQRPQVGVDSAQRSPVGFWKPQFVTHRLAIHVLGQRAHCHLLVGQSSEALQDLTRMFELRRLLEPRPMSIVTAMVGISMTGRYLDGITEGLCRNQWTAKEREALDSQLAQIHLLPNLVEGLQFDRVHCTKEWVDSIKDRSFYDKVCKDTIPPTQPHFFAQENLFIKSAPKGWLYLNLPPYEHFMQQQAAVCDRSGRWINPSLSEKVNKDVNAMIVRNWGLDMMLSALGVPGSTKSYWIAARNQTKADQARLALALERYHDVHGAYPEAIEALAPEFIKDIPPDVIGGQPLKYRRTAEGKFLLYSIGWNEQDDSGKTVWSPRENREKQSEGDWVWGGGFAL